ncbi:MAG: NUDIX domain-containing protein [Prolixibacteraceae bacterium]|nr:NUDIX domain-containing protein [Prolixibacteraceae bacterium]
MINKKVHKSEELFFVVDEDDSPMDPLPRRLVHGYGVWHRVSHVWIFDGKGNILCQQRALIKELNPGMWESFFGGHISPGESYTDGAVRELAEETGIKLQPQDFKQEMVYKRQDPRAYNNEFQGIFSITWHGKISDLRFDDGEVEQVKWVPIKDVLKHLKPGDKSWTFCGYEIDYLNPK